MFLVLTTLGPLFSGGACHVNSFAKFLEMLNLPDSASLASGSSDASSEASRSSAPSLDQSPSALTALATLQKQISNIYLLLVRFPQIVISVTRFLEDSYDCESPYFRNSFKTDVNTRRLLYDQVYSVGIVALEKFNLFNFDIRPPNIMHNVPIKTLHIIDWESAIPIPSSGDTSELNKLLSTGSDLVNLLHRGLKPFSIPAAVFLCERLIFAAMSLVYTYALSFLSQALLLLSFLFSRSFFHK